MAKKKELNARQEKFLQGLLEGKSQTQAYIDAGYSEKNARQHAYQLVTNSYFAEEYKARLEEANNRRRARLSGLADKALDRLDKLMDSTTRDDSVAMSAVKDALDRIGLKVAEQVEHTGEIRIVKEIVTDTDNDQIQSE